MKKISFGIFIIFISISASFGGMVYVSGTVKDKLSGEPIIGANVYNNAKGTGCYTGSDGSFKCLFSEDAQIEISFVGCQQQMLSVKDLPLLLQETGKKGTRATEQVEIMLDCSSGTEIAELVVVGPITGALNERCDQTSSGPMECKALSCVKPRYKLIDGVCEEQECPAIVGGKLHWVEDGIEEGYRELYLNGYFIGKNPYDRKDYTCVLESCDDGYFPNDDNTGCTNDAMILQDAVRKLDDIFGNLKVNKWRNEDGSFNTARLASDMTAGVVLGTAGALITSHLVKKRQVADGFEDLQCVIGGQTVAGWGDQINIRVYKSKYLPM